MEGAQVAAFFPPVRLRLVQGPRQHAMAVIRWRLRQLSPGRMVIDSGVAVLQFPQADVILVVKSRRLYCGISLP